MAQSRTTHGLEISQRLKEQAIEWKVERIAWVVMALILLAALAGLLGPGPLSKAVAGDRASALWVEYHRFERYQAPTKLIIHLTPPAREIRLWINYGFMRNVDLEHIDPEPERSEAGADRYSFPFVLNDTKNEIILTVYFKANEFGMLHTEMGLENGPSLRFSQMVYP